MRYLWYTFLGLFSLGFVGLIAAIAGTIYVVSSFGHDLPDYSQLKDYEPPVVSRLYAGDGRLMAEFAEERRIFVPIEAMPDLLKQAFIAAEDKNFYSHQGIDYTAIARAALTNLRNIGSGRRPEGASTITQQVAKNFLLTNEVSYKRKIREAILAYRMERAMSKDRLLELYLNEIYLGSGSYGVAAAALNYFNKSLEELNIPEMAYLAALPKAPNNYHPTRKYDAAVQRRNWVVQRMAVDGYITEEQADLAKIVPLKQTRRDRTKIVNAPYFAEEVRRELKQHFGDEGVYGGGLAVRSTIDPQMQEIAVNTLRNGLLAYDKRHGWRGAPMHFKSLDDWSKKLKIFGRMESLLPDWEMAVVLGLQDNSATIGFEDGSKGLITLADMRWARRYLDQGYALGAEIHSPEQVLKLGNVVMVEPIQNKEGHYKLQQAPDVQGALIALDPHTGRVLAMQGGWKYDSSEFNRATQARRQPGSAFKPFVYLAALDNGFTPATLVLDAPFVLEDRPGNIWKPSNYSKEYYGPTPLRVGVEKSRNLMTVRLADFLGMETVADYARKFGISERMQPHLANALGSAETTLLDLTRAYAVLVNGGKAVIPTFIDRIQDRRGSTVFRHDRRPCEDCGKLIRWEEQPVPEVPDIREQLADPRTAYQTVSILRGVVKRGTGVRINALRRPLAGKTGTTNASRDTWFIGFSPDLVVGVFVGFDEPRSLGKRETGSSVAVPIFKDFMQAALKNEPALPFRVPPGIRNVKINAETGARAKPGDSRTIWEAFLTGNEPTDEMYILDGKGISVMHSVRGSVGEATTTGTGGIY